MFGQARHIYEFGPFRLDPTERQLLRDGQAVALSPKAFDLLQVLVENSGHLLHKEELMNLIWPDSFIEEANLSVKMSALRRALGDGPDEHRYIETIPRQGYRFVAAVRECGGDAVERLEGEAKVKGRLRRTLRPQFVAAVLAVGGLAVALLYFWTSSDPKPQGIVPRSSEAVKTLAVLPFKPLAAEGRDEALELGMADSLITKLSNIRRLVIRPTSAIRNYTAVDQDSLAAGREQRVDAVLESSIQWSGQKMRVRTRLLDVGDGTALWTFECDAERCADTFEVQDVITKQVAEALTPELSGEETKQLSKRYTENTEAYALYQKGRYFLNKRTAEGFKRGIEYFQQAIEKDSNYALAYVGLADCYVLLEEHAGTPSRETLPKARAAVERALQIEDSLAEAHASLGMIEQYSWNFSEAEAEFKRAIELSPNYPTAHHWYSLHLRLIKGRFDEAMAEIKLAQQLDPISPVISNNVAQIYCAKGELDAAIEASKNVLELNPNFAGAHRVLGVVYRRQGRYDEAIAEAEKAVELSGRQSLNLTDLGQCYAVAGKIARARAILKELEEKYDKREALGQYLAGLHAALGDKERAFVYLEKDFQTRSGLLAIIAHNTPGDILRDKLSRDPRWNDLLRRIGLLT